MRLQIVSDDEHTRLPLPALQLVAPDERLTMHYGETRLAYRRLPLRVRAQHGDDWDSLDYCLLGWQGAVDAQGHELAYDRSLLGYLPGEIRELLLPRCREANPRGLPGQATLVVRRLPTVQFRAMLKSCTRRGEVQAAALTLRVLEYGVRDWSGAVCDASGQPVPFDPERLGWLPDDVVSQLWDVLTSGQRQTDDAVGNSGSSSTGSDT